MKICIVTIYNSENCGSFLQAYALEQYLLHRGNQVSFLYRPTAGTSHDKKRFLISCGKLLLKGRIHRLKHIIAAYKGFSKAVSRFKIIKRGSVEYKSQDLIIVGSDTLWNFDDEYFFQHRELYSGLLFKDKRAISYASSVANTRKETLIYDKTVSNGLLSLKDISTRDEYTADIVTDITGKRPPIVLDPTLLLEAKDYEEIEGECNYDSFILIYCFKELSDEKKRQLRDISSFTNNSIISFGNYREWADMNIPFDPHLFLAFFRKAKYVITDTYHGTIFSIIYRKQFICFGQHKNKVRDILYSLELNDRFLSEDGNPWDTLDKKINYDEVHNSIINARIQSMVYLEKNMEEE